MEFMEFCCFCPLSEATLVGGHQPDTHSELQCYNHKNHRNSINSINSILWNKISSAHHNSLHAMEFLESLDLPSLSACEPFMALGVCDTLTAHNVFQALSLP